MRKLFLIALAAALVAAPTASAAHGRDALTPSNPAPAFGETITFNVSTTAAYPWVKAECAQNDQIVYQQWAGLYPSYSGSQIFTLGPTELWTGGSASCTATLLVFDKRGDPRTLATSSFQVSP